ncbi:MAG: glycerol kinase GlpK [Armatimonadota bacterium]
MPDLILAIDQGTTGTTALVLDASGDLKGRGYAPVGQRYPRPGWVEQDPVELWQSTLLASARALESGGIHARDLLALGITNQRETTLLWERSSGRPVSPAVVWQCRRTTDICAALRADGLEPLVRQRTGLLLDPYFSGPKLKWLLDADPHLRSRAERGELAFGTVDSWLVWNLTGGAAHVTDPSNASRTLLLDLNNVAWDPELLRALSIPADLLPRIVPSSGLVGETVACDPIPAGLPISGLAGDQQAALFGQRCFARGQAKSTYGTGCFLLVQAGPEPPHPQQGILATIAWQVGAVTAYALEGSVFIAGAAVQWLRDELGIISDADETEALARSVPDAAGITFVPAFVGLGAPHWQPDARGAIVGITRGASRAHLARAALEAIAHQVVDVVEAMQAGGPPLTELRVDGGAAKNGFLMQFQADLLGLPVIRPRLLETTALGAALLAGLGIGLYRSTAELSELQPPDRIFRPEATAHDRLRWRNEWQRAVACALAWAMGAPSEIAQ